MLGNWRIPIRTLWERGEGSPEDAVVQIQRSVLRFTFGGWIPLPNLFGDDNRMDFNRDISAAGWDMVVRDAEYNTSDGSISVFVEVVSESAGGVTIAPLLAIVMAIGGIVGAILLISLLSKVEAVLELPIVWLIAGTVFISITVSAAKRIKGGGS